MNVCERTCGLELAEAKGAATLILAPARKAGTKEGSRRAILRASARGQTFPKISRAEIFVDISHRVGNIEWKSRSSRLLLRRRLWKCEEEVEGGNAKPRGDLLAFSTGRGHAERERCERGKEEERATTKRGGGQE